MMRESKPICQKWTTRREKKEMLVVRREEFADENQSYSYSKSKTLTTSGDAPRLPPLLLPSCTS